MPGSRVGRSRPDDEAAALKAWDQARRAGIEAEYREHVKQRESYADAADDDTVVILPSRSPDWPERARDKALEEQDLALLRRARRREKVLAVRKSLAAERTAASGRQPGAGGRPKGSLVETETFWKVWEMALDGRSARGIDKATGKNTGKGAGLEFVNRIKAGVIVKAVRKNRPAAHRALGGRKTPRGFRATSAGVVLPTPKRPKTA
jgi:hypothetical protein